PTMTWRQGAEWARAGMEIGSHGCHHLRLTRCAPEICDRELVDSKLELEQKFDTKIDTFSYPYGDYNEQVVRQVRAAGYLSAVTTRRGRVLASGDPLRMRRVDVNGRRGLMPFIASTITNYTNWLDTRPD